MFFLFTDDTNPESIQEIAIDVSMISCIEKNKVLLGTQGRQRIYHHVVIVHTRHELNKKRKALQFPFEDVKKCDELFESLMNLLKPEAFKAKWQLG